MKKENHNDFNGTQLIKQNKYQEGIPLLIEAIKDQPKNNILIRELGRAYMQINDLENAEKILDQALTVHPRDFAALNYLGLVKLQGGNSIEARVLFERSVKENYQNYLAYYYLAVLDNENKLYSSALNNLQLCLTYNGNFRAGYNLMANIYEAQGDKQRADQIRRSLK
jgi:tetratricopeptide (TPR) repeat protein